MHDNPLHRLIKLAATSPTGDPGTDAMAAAAQAAKGPAGMPLLKSIAQGKEKEGDESKEALRMAHELDAKSKEINGLRQQLQESKMDAMRTQLKADISAEQVKMRENMRKEQEKMRDSLRKEQNSIQQQIRAEQKELDRKQSQLQIEEAKQKGNITAAQAQYKADYTAATAEQRANLAIERAQHQAKLDSDVSAHDAEIAQHKADSLLDIAQKTSDMYMKQTEKAKSDADKYFSGQQKQYAAAHPAISPALQNRLDGAMKSVGRLGRALNDFTKQSAIGEGMNPLAALLMGGMGQGGGGGNQGFFLIRDQGRQQGHRTY